MSEKKIHSHTVKFGKRKLLVQSDYEATSQKAIVSVSESGKTINSWEYPFAPSAAEAEIQQRLRQCQDLVLADLELLHSTISNVQATQNADSYAHLGTLLLNKGFYDEAGEIFTALLNLNSRYENGRFLLGKAQLKKGDLKGALKNLEEAAKTTPDYPDVLYWLSRAYREAQDFSKAIQTVRIGLEINPEYHEGLFALATYLVESTQRDPKNADLAPPIERIKEARSCLLRAVDLSTAYDRISIDSVLEWLDDMDHWEQAMAELAKTEKAKAFDSNGLVLDSEFYLRFMFADLHKEHRSLDNYIKLLERSVSQNPVYPDMRLSLGTAYLIRCWHYFGKALEEYRESFRINPDYQKAKKNLKLLENAGRGFLLLLRAILK